jgi:hypothetical protein
MQNSEHDPFNPQTGAITILVALFLLVLLTICAVSMSHNALREVIISGTVKQGTEARNAADNGIEWSCYWLNASGQNGITTADPTEPAAADFVAKKMVLSHDPTLMGKYFSLPTKGDMANTETTDGATRSFKLDLMLMGKQRLELIGGAPSTGPGDRSQAINDQMLPDIWSVRSTGTLTTGGVTFQHMREGWITAPPQ